MEIEEGVISRGRRPRRKTPSEIAIILHMIRKPNLITVVLFLMSNFLDIGFVIKLNAKRSRRFDLSEAIFKCE